MKSRKILLSLILCIFTLVAFTVTSNAALNGDVDENTVYSTEDARLALIYAAGLDTPDRVQETAADINRDGYVTTDDAYEILRIACDLSVAPKHQYTAWVVSKHPNCTDDGVAYSGCYNCDETFTKILPASGHIVNYPSCTSNGECMFCGAIVDPKGHQYVNGVCSECGHTTIKPNVTYRGKSILFGATAEGTKALLGTPTEILTDNASSLGKVTIYVYAADYKNLGIFTFVNNKMTQFYSNNKTSQVVNGSQSYSLQKSGTNNLTIGDIEICPYTDNHAEGGKYVYSYDASLGGRYTFARTGNRNVAEKLILHTTNGMRAIHGLSSLTYCPKASTAAYKHSLDMATRGYFDHYTPEGKTPWERMEAEGVVYYAAAENIAAGYIDAYDISDGWYNSAGHRANILTPYLTHLGVGVAIVPTSDYRYYGTQNFYQYE